MHLWDHTTSEPRVSRSHQPPPTYVEHLTTVVGQLWPTHSRQQQSRQNTLDQTYYFSSYNTNTSLPEYNHRNGRLDLPEWGLRTRCSYYFMGEVLSSVSRLQNTRFAWHSIYTRTQVYVVHGSACLALPFRVEAQCLFPETQAIYWSQDFTQPFRNYISCFILKLI